MISEIRMILEIRMIGRGNGNGNGAAMYGRGDGSGQPRMEGVMVTVMGSREWEG
jgi:hypothetical protein